MNKKGQQSHSYIGLPDKGFRKVDQSYDWMIRAVVSSEGGKQPTHPKVTTYEDEKAADTESTEAQPVAEVTGTRENECLSRTTGHGNKPHNTRSTRCPRGLGTTRRRLQRRSAVRRRRDKARSCSRRPTARSFPSPWTGSPRRIRISWPGKPAQSQKRQSRPPPRPANSRMIMARWPANRASPAAAHAVKFKVDGDSWYVTSVSLHGSRYGEVRPPKENFNVWICDAQFKPIATFRVPLQLLYPRATLSGSRSAFAPTRVPADFIVCFGFNPHQTKGVYVSYDSQQSKTSMVGVPGESEPTPFAKGNWLIRCKVEKRTENGTSFNAPPSP